MHDLSHAVPSLSGYQQASEVKTVNLEKLGPPGTVPRQHARLIEPLPHRLLTTDVLKILKTNPGHVGFQTAGASPTLFFLVDGTFQPSGNYFFYSYGWDSEFGATLTVSLYWKGGGSCTFLPSTQQAFHDLKTGSCTVVIVRGERCVAALSLDLGQQPDFDAQWARVADHVPLMPDERASFWHIFGLHPGLRSQATPGERLSLGWANEYRRSVLALSELAVAAQGAPPLTQLGRIPPDAFGPLANITARPNWGAKDALEALQEIRSKGGASFLKFLAADHEFDTYTHEISGHAHCVLKTAATQAFLLGTHLTREGRFLPWLDFATGELRALQILPERFSETFAAEDYWARQSSALHINTGHHIGGEDVPMDLRPQSASWLGFPFAEETSPTDAAADVLIDEALAHRRWALEPGAIFELQVGPFARFQAWEHGSDIAFVARGPTGEYAELALDTREKLVVCNGLLSLNPETDKPARAHAALKLLLASLFRDFVVVEDRERVFSTVARQLRQGQVKRGQEDSPVVVYLPRIRYVGRPAVENCMRELNQEERRAHYVRAHLRRATRASEHQRALGQRYGFPVPENYTFVRPHERGKNERTVIYRSRSALLSLYEVWDPGQSVTGGANWFQFERDVNCLMERLGFVVEHTAASRRGDQGVDVYATRGVEGSGEPERWVIQCKCYAPHRKVGPAILRELLGAMRAYPDGTRGMVATTSTFTGESRRLAKAEGLRLMDGEEFSQLARLK
ncbi:restriction endonuclease [Archangium primigenium]|uniref:restriction endonuclease n=1 Tax=[Archangium] primigenium TaxID=2792470 RepID=UPI0019588FAB|nr:restriction endonuclease [Archangium primigenium]